MERLGGSRESIGPFVLSVVLGGPLRQPIARVDSGLQASFELAEWLAQLRFQRRNAIPTEHKLGSVMQQFA